MTKGEAEVTSRTTKGVPHVAEGVAVVTGRGLPGSGCSSPCLYMYNMFVQNWGGGVYRAWVAVAV